jgi:deoxyadenosine/deoxycytidine kinase
MVSGEQSQGVRQERYTLSPVLVIDADRLDFLNDMVDRIELLETIEKHI